MSVVRCGHCDSNIDTDHNVEHFIDGTEQCLLEVQESKIFILVSE